MPFLSLKQLHNKRNVVCLEVYRDAFLIPERLLLPKGQQTFFINEPLFTQVLIFSEQIL